MNDLVHTRPTVPARAQAYILCWASRICRRQNGFGSCDQVRPAREAAEIPSDRRLNRLQPETRAFSWLVTIAGIGEKIDAFCWREAGQRIGYGLIEGFDSSCTGLA
jgi:hypothetical protein